MTTFQLTQATNHTKVNAAGTLVVFDRRVSDIEILSQALLPGSIDFTIDSEANGLAAITDLLAITGAKYLAIVAHGEPRVVHLGKTPLNIQQLQAQSQLLQSWGVESIALYSCEVAKDDVGKDFIYQLSELTGATVAAAATKTGNRLLGGSWDLTVTTGEITAPILFDSAILERYPAVLAVSFEAATNFDVGTQPYSAIVGDFNGDGKLDLATANFGSRNVSVLLNTTVPALARNDFTGDGKSDILWRNDNGNLALWQMNRGTVSTSSIVATAVPTVWQIVDTGDFNGDKKAETLWRNTTDGNISIGSFNPTSTIALLISGSDPISWKVAGTDDFNGDAKSDILWRNTNGDVALWQMNGGVSTSQSVIGNAIGTWKIAGTSDFTGDGKADILWRRDNGSIALWQMNGSTLVSSSLTSIPSEDTSWKINGTDDFNGDGKADILWRNDNGSVAIWDMNGKDVVSRQLTSTPFADNSWKITGTSDFNSDGKADILWRNDSGAVAIWEMNGSTVLSAGLTSIPLVDNSWKIAAPIL